MVIMGLSRTVFEKNGDFGRKSQFFSPRVFKGLTWNFITAVWFKKYNDTPTLQMVEKVMTMASFRYNATM